MKCKRDRAGFTLVELLVVIAIITILAATAMFVMFKAESYGREGSTRVRVAALDRMVRDMMKNYASRRMDVPATPYNTYDDRRQAALDTLLRMDFPDHWIEIKEPRDENNALIPDSERSALSRAYKARYDALPAVDPEIRDKYEPAECLYLIVSMGAKGLDYFNDSDIGDTDGDGAFEFIDAWGRPIYFLRRPTGFPSQLAADQVNHPVHPVHLVVSGGPDKHWGININLGGGPLGTPEAASPDQYLDNIHSHALLDQ